MALDSRRGYPVGIFELDLKHRWLCVACANVLRSPHQVENGDLFCRNCLPQEDAAGEYFPDRAVEREILSLPVHCTKKLHGCDWSGELRALENHMANNCPIINKKEEDFLKKEPSEIDLILSQLEGTDNVIDNGKDCEFNVVGCSHKDLSKTQKESHNKASVAQHLILLLHFILNLEKIVKETLKEDDLSLAVTKGNMKDLVAQVVHETTSGMKTAITHLATTLEVTNDKLTKCESDLAQIVRSRESLFVEGEPIEDVVRKIQGLERQIVSAQQDQLAANFSLQDLNIKANENSDKVKGLEMSVDALFSTVRNALTSQTTRSSPTNGHVQAWTYAPCMAPEMPAIVYPPMGTEDHIPSFDGTLLWKVPKVSEMRTKAIRGDCKSFYSPPFFTGYRGYKLCGRLFLDGDGMAKGTHMSLFIALLRGPFDALLPWPFAGVVRMVLLDQKNMEHHVDSFLPDPGSRSFQRPVGAINKASGSPLFLPLSGLGEERFVKDDTMFIKITVEAKNAE